MFVIELLFKADLTAIDAHRDAHAAFLDQHYAAGSFLASGRKVPRDGGIILALADDCQQLEAVMREEPFVAAGLADFRVIEFRPSKLAPDMPQRITGAGAR